MSIRLTPSFRAPSKGLVRNETDITEGQFRGHLSAHFLLNQDLGELLGIDPGLTGDLGHTHRCAAEKEQQGR